MLIQFNFIDKSFQVLLIGEFLINTNVETRNCQLISLLVHRRFRCVANNQNFTSSLRTLFTEIYGKLSDKSSTSAQFRKHLIRSLKKQNLPSPSASSNDGVYIFIDFFVVSMCSKGWVSSILLIISDRLNPSTKIRLDRIISRACLITVDRGLVYNLFNSINFVKFISAQIFREQIR